MRNILSLDDNTNNKYIQCYILKYLEEFIESIIMIADNKRGNNIPSPDLYLGECFDLIAGSHLGAVTAILMRLIDINTNRPKFKITEILNYHINSSNSCIDDNPYTKNIYNFCSYIKSLFKINSSETSCTVDPFLEKHLTGLVLSDIRDPIIIPTYDLNSDKPYIFRNYAAKNKPKHNFKLIDVAKISIFTNQSSHINDNKYNFTCIDITNPIYDAYHKSTDDLYPFSCFNIISIDNGFFNPDDNKSVKIKKKIKLYLEI